MFILDENEMYELTGAKRRELQMENLRENDIPYTVGIDGKPRVLHSALLEKALNGFKAKAKMKKPDFSKVNF